MPDEYIRREAALKAANEWVSEACMAPVMRVSRLFDKLQKVPAADVAEVVRCKDCDAWEKAMSILDKKYAEAKKLPFIRDPLAWALYHTWREFDDGKRCD